MIKGVSYAGKPLSNTAMYISKKVEYLVDNLKDVSGCKVFVESTVNVPEEYKQKNEFIFTDSPQYDYTAFLQKMDRERTIAERKRKYTLTDAGYYIGENVTLGEGTYIEPGAFIGHDVVIGSNVYVKAGARIRKAIIGDNCVICENCTVGTDAFTMTEDQDGNRIRIPAFGTVVIKNNVEVGALSEIECSSAQETVIEDNVKIGSGVIIAHDTHIGKNVEIRLGVVVSGFTEVGDDVIIGAHAVLRNRIKVGDKAFIGFGSTVTKDVKGDIVVAGNPAKLFVKK